MLVAACQSMGRASDELEMGTIRTTLSSGIRLAPPLVKNAGIGDGVDQYGMTGIIGIKAIAAAARPAIVAARPPPRPSPARGEGDFRPPQPSPARGGGGFPTPSPPTLWKGASSELA